MNQTLQAHLAIPVTTAHSPRRLHGLTAIFRRITRQPALNAKRSSPAGLTFADITDASACANAKHGLTEWRKMKHLFRTA
jgi:hypothetical protein